MTQPTTRWLERDIGLIDLRFQGVSALIAAFVIPTDDGVMLAEVGPGSTLEALFDGAARLDVDLGNLKHILVTHIHLDHAGAAGSLLARYPDAQLYVHEVGAPHMIDPSRLLDSVQRIYGEATESLWGEFLACPAERIVILRDGDTVEVGGVRLQVLYTPGHASHHVSFYEQERGVLIAGDAAGVRVPPSQLVWPPTPPPDIDIEAWRDSVAKIRALAPAEMLVTHYGPFTDVDEHLNRFEWQLEHFVELVVGWQADGLKRDELVDLIAEDSMMQARAANESEMLAKEAALVTPFGMTVDGILRYLRKRRR